MLAPHIHAAPFGDRVVLLDVAADRYRLIGGTAARVIVAALEGRSDPSQVTTAALYRAGIFSKDGDAQCRPRPRLPVIPAGRLPDAVFRSKWGALSIANALLSMRVRLRCSGLARTLAGACANSRRARVAEHEMVAITVARAFARARPLIPLRQACLPDSLALLSLLKRAGGSATLVIGVRLDPFLAHCWVQTDQFVLNDDPDAVLAYTPILAL